MQIKTSLKAAADGLAQSARYERKPLPDPVLTILLAVGVWLGLMSGVRFETFDELSQWIHDRSSLVTIIGTGVITVFVWGNELSGAGAGCVRLVARASALTGVMAATFMIATFVVFGEEARRLLQDSAPWWCAASALIVAFAIAGGFALVWILRTGLRYVRQ